MTIELQDLVKTFGKKTAVDHVTLIVEDGGFTVLLGPSGCGKTTTLRMIAGLEKPQSGEILLDNRRVTDLSPKERGVAMVFQDYGLYPHMSVFDNVAFPLKIARVDRDSIQARVKEMLDRLRIAELAHRKPAQISGGEKQRVSLARALVRRPNVLLMDEPLSNLDALLRLKMRAEIKALHQETGTTTLYVTHDQVEALSLGTAIVVMNKGRIEQCGTPSEIYYQPVTQFVAQFVGSPPMNFMSVSIVREGGLLTLQGEGVYLKLSGESSAILEESLLNRSVVFGVRPEHFTVSAPNGPWGIHGIIKIIEPLGKDHYLHVEVGKAEITVRTDPEEVYKVGDRVCLTPTPRYVYFFDPESGIRIR